MRIHLIEVSPGSLLHHFCARHFSEISLKYNKKTTFIKKKNCDNISQRIIMIEIGCLRMVQYKNHPLNSVLDL